eukprot:6195122-Amphidinium_carterae.1
MGSTLRFRSRVLAGSTDCLSMCGCKLQTGTNSVIARHSPFPSHGGKSLSSLAARALCDGSFVSLTKHCGQE